METNENMVMRYAAAGVVSALCLLAACSGGNVALQPGSYEINVRFTSVDMPGATASDVARMRANTTQPRSRTVCLNAQDAANPIPLLLGQNERPNSCQFNESSFAGGVMHARAACAIPGRGPTENEVDGSYTGTTMEATLTVASHAPPATPGPQSVRMSGTLTARRTGDCP